MFPARLPGLGYRRLVVHLDGGGSDLPLPGAVLQRHRHIGYLSQLLLQSGQSLFPGHPPHRHAGHGDAVQNGGRTAHPGTQAQIAAQQDHRHTASGDKGDLLFLVQIGIL